MDKLIKSTLLSSISAGGRIKAPRQPNIWCGESKNGYTPGDLVDANGLVDFIIENDVIHDDPEFLRLKAQIEQEVVDRTAAIAAMREYINQLIQELIGASTPEALDTLAEIAEVLLNDPDIINEILARLSVVETTNAKVIGDTLYLVVPNVTDPKPYVEIAGIKWAKCNIGAENPWDNGLYFQWGDTQGYSVDQIGTGAGLKAFTLGDYKYYDTLLLEYTKYTAQDNKTTLDSSDDAAVAILGDGWRMPTYNECMAFKEAVDTEYTDDYNDTGVAGVICTDKTDSSKVLFFPISGLYSNGSKSYDQFGFSHQIDRRVNNNDGGCMPMWESRYGLTFSDQCPRTVGITIRPVKD